MNTGNIVKNCYHSVTGSRKPKCRQSDSGLCPSCLCALVVYQQHKAAKKISRMQRNRDASSRSKMRREERSSDLYSDHIALTTERDDLALELEIIIASRDAMAAKIATKLQQMAAFI